MTDIAKEYGTAVFLLACEQKAEKEFADSLDIIKSTLLENPEYMEFLKSPAISLNERLSSIKNVLIDKVPEQVLSYLHLLCERGRMSCFFRSVEEYNLLYGALRHISKAKVTSAVSLTEDQKANLIKKLEAVCKGRVDLECEVDEKLLGGIIVEADGKIMDGSLRQRLRDIREVID